MTSGEATAGVQRSLRASSSLPLSPLSSPLSPLLSSSSSPLSLSLSSTHLLSMPCVRACVRAEREREIARARTSKSNSRRCCHTQCNTHTHTHTHGSSDLDYFYSPSSHLWHVEQFPSVFFLFQAELRTRTHGQRLSLRLACGLKGRTS